MIIVGTDFHFGARNDDPVVMQAQLDFLDNVFFPAIEQHKVTHFLDLGDTWDKRKIHNIRTYNIFRERFFDRLEAMGVKTIMLIGNHDVYYKNTNDVNSVSILERDYENIRVVNGFEDITIGNYTFGMMSWINNQNYEQAKEFIKTSKADIVCGHFEAVGFEILPGVKTEHGIDPKMFSHFEQVWSGHFHIPSKVGNFEYIGNPFDLNWSDYKQRKSVMLFDENTGARQFVTNPCRLFASLSYTDDIDILTFDFGPYQNKFVRLNIESLQIKDNSKLSLFIDKMQQVAYNLDVSETGKLEFSDVVSDTETDAEIDTLSKIVSVVSSMELAGLDKSKLTARFKQLYEDAEERMSQ